MQDETQNIKIRINGLEYPMTVASREEEAIRLAAKKTNEVINDYRQKGHRRPEHLLSMALIQIGTEKLKLEQQEKMHEVINDLKDLNTSIELFNKENIDALNK